MEGPSDKVMRLLGFGLLLAGVVLLGVNHISFVMNDAAYLLAMGLGPFALMLGIGGAISPNVLRAAGKYGKHLPIQYKLIAGGLGLVAVLMVLLLVFVAYPLGR